MKGPYGLVLAILLGVLALVLNAIYLYNKQRDLPSQDFIAVKEGVKIKLGQEIEEQHLVRVKIPKQHNASELKNTMFLYEELPTVIGIHATKQYLSGDMIARKDYVTSNDEIALTEDQSLYFLSISSLNLEPDLIDPGAMLYFQISQPVVQDTRPLDIDSTVPAPALASTRAKMIGPFEVVSIGERIGEKNVATANGVRQGRARTIGLIVNMEGNGLSAESEELIELVGNGGQRVNVVVLGSSL